MQTKLMILSDSNIYKLKCPFVSKTHSFRQRMFAKNALKFFSLLHKLDLTKFLLRLHN